MADGIVTYEEAVGAAPLPVPSTGASDGSDGDSRELTVHLRPQGASPKPSAAAPVAAPTSDAPKPGVTFGTAPISAPAPSGVISYEDATAPDTPHAGGLLSNSPDDTMTSAAMKAIPTTVIKGLAHIPGIFGDAMDLGDYLLARAQAKIQGRPADEVLKEYAADRAASAASPTWFLDPRNVLPSGSDISDAILAHTGEYKPTSEPGRLAMAGGEAALGMLGPGGGVKALLPNAVVGAVGQGVADVTGDPLLGMVAAPVALGGAKAAAAAAKKVVAPAVLGVPGIDSVPVVGPAVSAARDQAAGGAILKQSSDPAALRDWAQQPPAPSPVPGSPQTLAGAVGNDRGLFQAEKDARNVDNGPFNEIDRQQSAAQQGAIQSVQPTGDVFRPGQLIRQRLDAVDQAAQAAEDRLNAAHQDAVAQRAAATQDFADQQRAALADRTMARGQASGDEKAAAQAAADVAHQRLVGAFQDAHDQAAQAASQAAAPLANVPSPEQTGAVLRAAQDEATSAARQARSALYAAVDPDGTLTTVVTPLKAAQRDLAASIDPHAGTHPTGAEATLWRDIARMPDVIPFKSLMKLDSRVTAAMKAERMAFQRGESADPEALGRLTRLKGAVASAIENAADNQAAHEANLVKSGVLEPHETMEARLAAEREQFLSQRSARAASGGAGDGTSPTARSARAARPDGAIGQEGRGSAPNAVTSSVSGEALPPNFDQAAAERLAAAKAAHADYAQTYKNPIVRPILDTTGFAGQFKIPAGAIPSRAIVAGPKGYDTAAAFIRATGGTPEALTALQNAALQPLKKAVPPAGNLHPNALARWKENYAGALRALDEASPGFSRRFDNAAAATQAVLDLGVEQKQALANAQREAARKAVVDNLARRESLGQANAADRAQVNALLSERAAQDRAANAQSKADLADRLSTVRSAVQEAHASPAAKFLGNGGDRIASTEVENAVGSMLKTGSDGATRMRSLVGSVQSDPEALAGLRKAGVDWMVRNFQNADGTLAGAKFIDFIRDNRDTLRELYPSAQVSMFGAVARDAEVNARWRTQTAIKGGSDTVKNARPLLAKAGEAAKHTSMAVVAIEAMREGFERHGYTGAAVAGGGAAAAYLINGLRSAGIRSVADLYREALADPEKARLLISKMPPTPEGGKLRALTGLLRRELIVGNQKADQ